HGGDEARRIGGDPQHRAGSLVALMLELHDPRAPRGDEAVLGRDEERVQEDEARDSEQLEGEGHAPSGARVLGGRSSSKRIAPKYRAWAHDTNTCSMLPGCRSPIGKSRARSR